MEDMVEVRVNVPMARETEFYRWFADWRDGRLNELWPASPTNGGTSASPKAELTYAVAWWNLLRRNERDLWTLWIDSAPRLLKAKEIVEALELSGPREIPGILSWVGRKGKKVGFKVTWRFTSDPDDGSPTYGIDDPDYAALLKEARRLAEERA